MKPDKAVIRCICGQQRTVRIGGERVSCKCGAQLRIERKHGGWHQPWATVDDFKAMKEQGVAKYNQPKIVQFKWSR